VGWGEYHSSLGRTGSPIWAIEEGVNENIFLLNDLTNLFPNQIQRDSQIAQLVSRP